VVHCMVMVLFIPFVDWLLDCTSGYEDEMIARINEYLQSVEVMETIAYCCVIGFSLEAKYSDITN